MKPLLIMGLLLLTPQLASGRTWYITPDGTGDAPTIHAGIDSAAAGDTVLVGCGIHYVSGIHMRSGIVLLGEESEGDCATIDAQENAAAINCFMCDSTTIIEGLVVMNGVPYFSVPTEGGGLQISSSWLTVRRCVFFKNRAGHGGAVVIDGGHVTFEICTFKDNWADHGAAIHCSAWDLTIRGCTFVSNTSDKGTVYLGSGRHSIMDCTFYANYVRSTGSGLHCSDFSSPAIGRTIFCGGLNGAPISCGGYSFPTLGCCNIYGNAGGDWVGCIDDQYGVNGNFSADPKFCDTTSGDFSLEECSPCLPGNHPDGLYCWAAIGAYGSGCACGYAHELTSWGTIKFIYR